MVTICPYLTRTVLVYTCHSRLIINATPFHSQKDPGLDKKLYGHLVYGESCRWVSSEEKMKLDNKVHPGEPLEDDVGSKCVALGSEEKQGMGSRGGRECPQCAELTACFVAGHSKTGVSTVELLCPRGHMAMSGDRFGCHSSLGGMLLASSA